MSKPVSSESIDSLSDATPGSVMGFERLMGLLPAGNSPARRGQIMPAVSGLTQDDEGDVGNPRRAVQDLTQTNSPGQNKEEDNTFLILAALVGNKTDENGDLSSVDTVSLLDMIERVGINVNPIKNLISDVAGVPYAQFAASGGRISSEDLLGRMQYGRDYISHGRGQTVGTLIPNAQIDSRRGIAASYTDGVGEGLCARGTRSVLSAMGFRNLPNANATNWDEALQGNSQWRRVTTDLSHIREGSIIIVQNNAQSGRGASYNGHGAEFGHISVALRDPNHAGGMVFVSDKVRNSVWGSVEGNRVIVFEPVTGAPAPAQLMANSSHHRAPQPAFI